MRTTILLGTIAAIGLSLAACNQNTASAPQAPSPPNQVGTAEPAPGSKNETVSAAKDAVAGAVGKLNAELTSSTKGFVQAAAMSDMYEIEAAKIAMERGRAKDVKDFARKMADAHTMTTAALKDILSKDGLAIDPQPEFDSRHQGLINDLKGAKTADFDGRYIAQQQNAHSEALTLMKGYAESGDQPDIKAFAADTEPHVQMHLDMINKIADAHKMRERRADNR